MTISRSSQISSPLMSEIMLIPRSLPSQARFLRVDGMCSMTYQQQPKMTLSFGFIFHRIMESAAGQTGRCLPIFPFAKMCLFPLAAWMRTTPREHFEKSLIFHSAFKVQVIVFCLIQRLPFITWEQQVRQKAVHGAGYATNGSRDGIIAWVTGTLHLDISARAAQHNS